MPVDPDADKAPAPAPAPEHDAAWPDGWAALYDAMDVDRRPHLSFYAGLVTPEVTSLLDLGCGTGSITLAMAARMAKDGQTPGETTGGRVTGVDLSPRMIEIARARAPEHDWRVGDICAPPVDDTFDLIVCCFHTLQVLLDEADLARCFAFVAAHLAPGGRFAFDIYRPNLDWLATIDDTPKLARRFTDSQGRALHVMDHNGAYDPETRVLSGAWVLYDSTTGDALPLEPIVQRVRQYFPEDIERLLAGAGLVAAEHYGDLDGAPGGPGRKLQVYVCRKA